MDRRAHAICERRCLLELPGEPAERSRRHPVSCLVGVQGFTGFVAQILGLAPGIEHRVEHVIAFALGTRVVILQRLGVDRWRVRVVTRPLGRVPVERGLSILQSFRSQIAGPSWRLAHSSHDRLPSDQLGDGLADRGFVSETMPASHDDLLREPGPRTGFGQTLPTLARNAATETSPT